MILEKIRQYGNDLALSKSVEQWYKDTYIDGTSKPLEVNRDKIMHPGKIYSFKYFIDPKLRINDIRPVFMPLYHKQIEGSVVSYGINFNLIPPKFKAIVLDKVFRHYYNQGISTSISNLQNGLETVRLKIDYREIKHILRNTGYELAVTPFKIDKITSESKIISYDEWWKLYYMSPKFINDINVSTLYDQFNTQKSQSIKHINELN